MPVDLIPLLGFAIVASITPGPNNTLLLIAGTRQTFRESLPLILGIFLGFSVMLFSIGWGLGNVFALWPPLHTVLKILGAAYLLFLAWKLARAKPSGPMGSGDSGLLSFPAAAALQWVNPKAWYMAVSAMSLYVPPGAPPLSSVATVTAFFMLAGIPCCLAWFFFGTALSGFLTSPRRVKAFNLLMALLLVLSIVPILF